MSIKQIVGDYFSLVQSVGTEFELKPGVICWIPIMEQSNKSILEIKRNPLNTSVHNEIKFDIVDINSNHFKNKNILNLPIKNIQLDAHQELLISRSKKRPCIILEKFKISKDKLNTIQDEPQKKLAKHLSKSVYIAAPLYSCSTASEPGSFGPEMTYRIEHLLYNHLFYLPSLPKNSTVFSQLTSANGGILRLDEAFSFMKNDSVEPEKNFILSDSAMTILNLQFSSVFLEHSNYSQIKQELNNKFYSEYPILK